MIPTTLSWHSIALILSLGLTGFCLAACAERMSQQESPSTPVDQLMSKSSMVESVSVTTDLNLVSANRYDEAPLPAGFVEPEFLEQPGLEIVPAHRVVEGRSFGQCFRHISRNDIPMTAPVFMTMDMQADGNPSKMQHMRFVFPSIDTESPVRVPGARVLDVAERRVLSMYVKGSLGNARIGEALIRMRTWLAATHPELEPINELTVLGYNSPMVMSWKKLWAIQLPVQKRDAQLLGGIDSK